MVTRDQSPAPPYVSYAAFRQFLEDFRENGTASIERTVWDTRLGDITCAQVLTALRFLELVTPLNEPTPALVALAQGDGKKRAETLAALLQTKYAGVLDVLKSGARSGLEEAFVRNFGTTGDTTRKCIGFLLHAAMEARCPISSHILKGRRVPSLGPAAGPLRMDGSSPYPEGPGESEVPTALRGLLASLPQPGPLSPVEKDAWKRTLEAVLDLLYPTAGVARTYGGAEAVPEPVG